MDPRIVDPPLAPGQPLTVIAPEHHDRVLGQFVSFQLRQDLTDLSVHQGNDVVVTCPVPPGSRSVGDVGRQRDLRRIMHQPVKLRPDLALVRNRQVDHAEERLSLGPTAPVTTPATTFVPGGQRRFEVVVGLRTVGAVVTGGPEVLGETPYVRWRHDSRPHVLAADRDGIDTGDQARPRHGTHTRMRETSSKDNTLGSQSIDVRRGRILVAVASQAGTDVLATDPQNIGTIGRRRHRRHQRQKRNHGEQQQAITSHHLPPFSARIRFNASLAAPLTW